MILVPGPHVLNGAMDLIAARINLGASRLVYGGLIILVISVGLLLGMAFSPSPCRSENPAEQCPYGWT